MALRVSALPIDMTSDETLERRTPQPIQQPRSPKLSGLLTRRSSFVHLQVFTPNDFDMGETLGFGFFGKALKVSNNTIYSAE